MNNIKDRNRIATGLKIQLPIDENYVDRTGAEIDKFNQDFGSNFCSGGSGYYFDVDNDVRTTEETCTQTNSCTR